MFAPTVLGYLRACHPEPTLTVTAIAAGLTVSFDQPLAVVALVATAVLTGQLSVGWLNDYLDAPRDLAAERLDKPLANRTISRRGVGVAACCAGVACVPLSLANGLLAGLVHLFAVASAWCYDLGLKSTPASILPYALSFGLLPAFVALTSATNPAWWLVTGGALLGSGAHFANTLPDVADDEATGVRGLPQRLGSRWGSLAAVVLLVASMLVLVLGPTGRPTVTGMVTLLTACAILAIAAAARHRAPHAPFRAFMLTALLAVLLLITSGR